MDNEHLPSLAGLNTRQLAAEDMNAGDGGGASGGWRSWKEDRKRRAERPPPRPPRRAPDNAADAADNQVLKNIQRIVTRYERSDRDNSKLVDAIDALRDLIIGLHDANWVINVLFRQKTLIELVLAEVRRFQDMARGDERARARASAQAMPEKTDKERAAKAVAFTMAEFTDNVTTMRIRELLLALPPGSRPADNTYAAQDATRRAVQHLERQKHDDEHG